MYEVEETEKGKWWRITSDGRVEGLGIGFTVGKFRLQADAEFACRCLNQRSGVGEAIYCGVVGEQRVPLGSERCPG